MLNRFALVACAVGLFALVGCGAGRLDVTNTLSLEAADATSQDLDPQPGAQKITVEFASSNGNVTVYAFKKEDARDPVDADKAAANKDKALAVKTGKGETFSVDVPAKTAMRFIFVSSAKTSVTVKLSNRK